MGNLMATPEFYDPFLDAACSYPLAIAPLYSQPVLELTLRIPIYVHFDQGWDRGLARRAFAGDIPEPIRQRRWKDRAPGSFEEITIRNRDFMRETILGGSLAQNGLIDQVAVENVLRGDLSNRSFFVGELYTFLDLEMWLRHFTGSRLKQAAV
jgi:asparagine synthase (glutamine-hydrolysing)